MKPINKHALKYGLGIAAVLILYLMIMTVLGQVHNYNLRFVNFIIIGTGIFLSIKKVKRNYPEWFGYLRGIGIGFFTSLVAATSFSVIAAIILFSNPEFVEEARQTELQGQYLNTFTITMIIFMEAFTSGLLFAYASMQWLKAPSVHS